MATMSIRIDDGLKRGFDEVARGIGLSTTAAVTVMMKRFVDERGFPFDVKAPRYVDFADEGEVADLMDELSMEALADEG